MYLYLPILTALVSFTSAQSDVTASSGTGSSPSQNGSYFEQYNQRPNATGSGHLVGANTSEIPLFLSFVNWDTQINVTEVPWTGNQTVTNTVISLSASENDFAANSSWETCVVLFTNVPRNVTVKGQDDTGDCTALYSNDCISNFTVAIQDARAKATSRDSTGTCGSMSFDDIPSQCAGSILLGSIAQNVTSNQTDGSAWMYESSDPHDSTNLTFYDEAVTRIWPIMLIQNPSADVSGGAGFTHAELSCLRAENVTSGSKEVMMFREPEIDWFLVDGHYCS
ncbi:uncharacterized protein EAF01_008067 [Botrytis porri]|uniref:uncharacterized protein n=1 Tax=Botrytis porri TaxID=87229 RepID=UPI0019014C31|nr:uncharacterized protein EAF01_008067 [Botrytis porri]KAF7898854.1 hypothetical protein EAF01_008067 [Botrytis porri]